MLEIIVEPQRTMNLRHAITEAIKTGSYDSLYDDIRDCFTDEQIEEMMEQGCCGFIQKPFSINALSQKIMNILND